MAEWHTYNLTKKKNHAYKALGNSICNKLLNNSLNIGIDNEQHNDIHKEISISYVYLRIRLSIDAYVVSI